MSEDFADLLISVRKGYRLLNAYHRCILDAARSVADRCDKDSFEHWDNDPNNSGRVTNPKVFNSARGMIKMSSVNFCFSSGRPPRKGEWLLDFYHYGDSGYEEFDDWEDPDPSRLPPVEESITLIRLSALIIDSGKDNTWWDLWKGSSYPDEEGAEEKGNVVDLADDFLMWTGSIQGCDLRWICRDFDITEFLEEQSLQTSTDKFLTVVNQYTE